MVAGWIASELGVSAETVLAVAADDGSKESPLLELKDGEWAAFVKKLQHGRDRSGEDFVVDGWTVTDVGPGPKELTQRLSGVGQVRRVREVRALLGFRRHNPGADLISCRPWSRPTSAARLPSHRTLRRGNLPEVRRRQTGGLGAGPVPGSERTSLSIVGPAKPGLTASTCRNRGSSALHTIAHLLIRRLAFASGYSSASLQERIYASTDRPDRTAGILIYTAAGDAQGTLGGLVRLGEPKRLLPLLVAALDDARLCSPTILSVSKVTARHPRG